MLEPRRLSGKAFLRARRHAARGPSWWGTILFCAAFLAATLCVSAPLSSAPRARDAVDRFRTWFSLYRKGGIALYQKSAVPIRGKGDGEIRYFKSDEVERMDRLLSALAGENTLEAAKLLTEAATFRFDRRDDVEVRKYAAQQPWVLRRHAAAMLARITDEKTLEWLRAHLLESRSLWDSAYRRSLGARIFATAADDPSLLIPSLGDQDPRVRAEVLRSLARSGSIKESDAVLERLSDKDEEVRIAAVEAAGGILKNDNGTHPDLFYRCLERIVPLIEDRSWSVKDAALSFLEHYRSVRSIPILIDYLERAAGGKAQCRVRTYNRVAEVLKSLTGVTSPGTDPARWKTWWKENKDTFVLPPEAPMRPGYQTGTARFFSIPVDSDRVLFILDISGSMSAPLEERGAPGPPQTKLERARIELERTLKSLHPKVLFNILLFNDKIMRFAAGMQAATAEHVEKALRFFTKAKAGGGTNLFDALNAALSLRDIGTQDRIGKGVLCDTVFLLSDGVPTTGLVINPGDIVDIISRANRTKRIRIHTVYIGAGASPFMEELARRNLGRSVHVRQR